MFPLVLVWVRQLGAWKPHPYNFIVQIYVYYLLKSSIKIVLPIQHNFGIIP